MSSNSNEEVSREVAWRVFAREYNDAGLGFKEGEDERAPNYVATPTGAKINRLFVTGVLTEVERVGEDDLLRARVSDPTGTFVVYAGQYQPDAVSFFADAETPEFVAVVGKARTYEPEDSDEVYTSVRPEEVNVVDAETRDRWNVETAQETLKRIEAVREYLRTGETLETHPELHELGDVVDHYGTDEAYLNELERESREVLTEIAGVEAGSVGAGGGSETVDATEAETRVETDTDTGAEAGVEAETEPGTPEDSTEETATETGVEDKAQAGTESEESTPADDGFEDIDQEEVGDWEWDEGQREEVEEEFGAEFESGSELAEEDAETGEESEEEMVEEADEPSTPEPEPEPEEAAETEETETGAPDESAETVVMDIIEAESGDDGVERSEILSKATDRGIGEEVAEATLEDLLLEGMCYPTDGDRIKPI